MHIYILEIDTSVCLQAREYTIPLISPLILHLAIQRLTQNKSLGIEHTFKYVKPNPSQTRASFHYEYNEKLSITPNLMVPSLIEAPGPIRN